MVLSSVVDMMRVDPTPSICHYMDMQFESQVQNPKCRKELKETAGEGYSLNTENTLVKINKILH